MFPSLKLCGEKNASVRSQDLASPHRTTAARVTQGTSLAVQLGQLAHFLIPGAVRSLISIVQNCSTKKKTNTHHGEGSLANRTQHKWYKKENAYRRPLALVADHFRIIQTKKKLTPVAPRTQATLSSLRPSLYCQCSQLHALLCMHIHISSFSLLPFFLPFFLYYCPEVDRKISKKLMYKRCFFL